MLSILPASKTPPTFPMLLSGNRFVDPVSRMSSRVAALLGTELLLALRVVRVGAAAVWRGCTAYPVVADGRGVVVADSYRCGTPARASSARTSARCPVLLQVDVAPVHDVAGVQHVLQRPSCFSLSTSHCMRPINRVSVDPDHLLLRIGITAKAERTVSGQAPNRGAFELQAWCRVFLR